MRVTCPGAEEVRSADREQPEATSASERLRRTCALDGPGRDRRPVESQRRRAALYRNRRASLQTWNRFNPQRASYEQEVISDQ